MTSTTVDQDGLGAAEVTAPRRRTRSIDRLSAVMVAVLALVVLVAVFANLIAPHDPDQTDILNANGGVSAQHLLGTDAVGRDILSRMLYAARLSLLGPAIVVVAATLIGVALALWCAWSGGAVDALVSRVLDLLFATPSLLLAILGVAVLGPGIVAPVIALTIAYIPWIARVARTTALEERNKPYVEACELVGMRGWLICLRHIAPNMQSVIVAQVTITFGAVLVDLAAISFLGLGVQPPAASWGVMIANGEAALVAGHPLAALVPGLAIVGVVALVNGLGSRRRASW